MDAEARRLLRLLQADPDGIPEILEGLLALLRPYLGPGHVAQMIQAQEGGLPVVFAELVRNSTPQQRVAAGHELYQLAFELNSDNPD